MAMSMILQIFGRMNLAQRTAEDREILRVHVHQASLDRAPARDAQVGQELLLVRPKSCVR